VDPRASRDDVKIKFLPLPGHELRPLCRPARSQSIPIALFRLPLKNLTINNIKNNLIFYYASLRALQHGVCPKFEFRVVKPENSEHKFDGFDGILNPENPKSGSHKSRHDYNIMGS
jgi:hypothetical protein